MKRQPIESSNIVSAGHEDGVMEVEFKNGAVYQFANVDSLIWEKFLESDSKGSFFHQYIKDYPTTKIKEAQSND